MKRNLIIVCLVALMAITGNAKTTVISGVINTIHTDDFMSLFVENKTHDRPAVIDVSAEWCGWCKRMHPHLETLAKKYSGQIDFFQPNYETDLDLIHELGVTSYPTLIYIKTDGSMVVDSDGYRTAEVLDATFQEVFFNR